MALYKGIELSSELASSIRYMDDVEEYREELRVLQGAWDNLSLLGQLSGTHIDIGPVREAFAGLTGELVHQLGLARRAKEERALAARAQVAIDILVRNLYERTADIGFLATDFEIRKFAAAEPPERAAALCALRERFRDYQRKYTVYEDVVLLGLDGAVLARLEDAVGPAVSRDPLVRECLETRAPYVELYRKSDLFPEHERALVYAYRVMSPDDARAVGVLCLCFRFEDEAARIFAGLVSANEACVVGMLDAHGQVLATSETRELPRGARVPRAGRPGHVEGIRLAGRPYLAVTCATGGYQGYLGPGWLGFAMAPLEFVFHDTGDAGASLAVPEATRALLLESERLYSPTLRAIPGAAERLQAEPPRAVWTGTGALARAPSAGARFSKVLLGEIGATGERTREVFSRALADLHGTVLSSTLRDMRARALLATDIMDRNLYERANDCRWWALTPAFRAALAEGDLGPEAQRALTGILVTINGLYTVYTSLLVFDVGGLVVAASSPQHRELVGARLEAAWVGAALRLDSTDAYAVSDFEPSALYGGRPSYVYLAAVREPGAGKRVVGGIAIVFDAEPQFRAMLEAALPRAADGRVLGGAFGLFVDAEGRVVSSTRDDLPAGARAPFADVLLGSGEEAAARVHALGDTLYALGLARSTGYREYKGPEDRYRNDVQGVIAVPLCTLRDAVARGPEPRRSWVRPARVDAGAHLELAIVAIAGIPYALEARDVLEALPSSFMARSRSLVPHMCGYLTRGREVLVVLDIRALLHGGPERSAAGAGRAEGEVVVLRAEELGLSFGLWVDAVYDVPDVPVAQLMSMPAAARASSGLLERLVCADGEGVDAGVLSTRALARLAQGAPSGERGR